MSIGFYNSDNYTTYGTVDNITGYTTIDLDANITDYNIDEAVNDCKDKTWAYASIPLLLFSLIAGKLIR